MVAHPALPPAKIPMLNRLAHWRPALRTETLALLVSVLLTLLANESFWSALLAGRDPAAAATWLLVLCTGLLITAGQWFLLLLVLNRWTAKPLLMLLALLTTAAVYFMTYYHVYLDQPMLRNLLETDVKEAADLLSWKMIPWLLLGAALPMVLLTRVRLVRDRWQRALLQRAGALQLAMLVAAGSLWPVMDQLVPTLREHKELRFLVTPSNYIYSLARIASHDSKRMARARIAVGTDATVGARTAGRKPVVLVVVIGETVRAANWGLSGYARQTTPELAAIPGLINFVDVKSCGTNTETSVPCMFSAQGRRHYDEDAIRGSESLLHVLDHAGIGVLWRDNQSGCKGVCAGLPVENFFDAKVPGLCTEGRCLDEILLSELPERIARTSGDLVIVLHTMGNHGPAYYQRYPAEFRRFVPTCDSTDLGSCPRADVVNSYDNAILYTDHVLASAIALLAGSASHDSALLYVSDHGESLGENNIYLHSLPYAIAPDTQTRVPMVLWLSPGLTAAAGIDRACMAARAQQPASHDNLFHTVLGLLDVQTAVYDRTLDLGAGC